VQPSFSLTFFKAYKRFVHQLTLYLAIAALIYSIIFALQILPVEARCGVVMVRSEQLCTALGFLVEYAAWVMLQIHELDYNSPVCTGGIPA